MATNKRLQKELQENAAKPLPGCIIEPQESDMNIWNVYMDGPAESVYVGGRFHIQVTLPKEYPFKPPVVAFRTKIYHPNVSNDDKGAMCLGMLKAEEWKPPNKIADVLKLVKAVLAAPQPDDAIETAIADQFKNDFKSFEKEAKMWTSKYAMQ